VSQAPRVTFLLIRTRSQPKDNLIRERLIVINILVVPRGVNHTLCYKLCDYVINMGNNTLTEWSNISENSNKDTILNWGYRKHSEWIFTKRYLSNKHCIDASIGPWIKTDKCIIEVIQIELLRHTAACERTNGNTLAVYMCWNTHKKKQRKLEVWKKTTRLQNSF